MKLTPAREAALRDLAVRPRSSWDFGASTVSWLRKEGYATTVDRPGGKQLELTLAGLAALNGSLRCASDDSERGNDGSAR